jgi:hypothetical protein
MFMGATEFLSYPIQPAQLTVIVNAVLARRKAQSSMTLVQRENEAEAAGQWSVMLTKKASPNRFVGRHFLGAGVQFRTAHSMANRVQSRSSTSVHTALPLLPD